jgi:hypothetical protein
MDKPDLAPKRATEHIGLVFPDDKGRWHAVSAVAEIIDGAYHKLTFQGFETRSGQGFGITATFHVFDSFVPYEGRFYAKIRKVVVQNGIVISSEVVGEREEIILNDDPLSGLEFRPLKWWD